MEREEAGRLVETYGQAVYRLAYARTASREDAEDIVQETFLRLVRKSPEFRDAEHCRAWLLRVAANCAGDLLRSSWRRRTRPLEEAGALTVPEPEVREDGAVAAVLALPERYRTVIHLFYYEEMSVAEIASILGQREGTVRTRLSRGRSMLRQMLEEKGGETHVSYRVSRGDGADYAER